MAESTTAKVFLCGALAGASIVAAVSAWVTYRQKLAPSQKNTTAAAQQVQKPLDLEDEIIKEHLSRNLSFFGHDGCVKLSKSHIVVVGLGGVGSHAAHMLLRSGVGRITLVDFDQVTLSSLNRHAVATRSDIGQPKATVLARHFQQIFPEVHVEAMVEMYTASSEDRVLGSAPDFVLDAIDNMETKVHLLAACKQRNLPVLCVGGAGAKADPTRLRFLDIGEASIDPLVRSVRHHLRTKFNISQGLDVLISDEKPRCGLFTTDEQATAPSILDYQVIPNFRIRTIPVLGTSPAIFGMAAASWILCQLVDKPFFTEPLFQIKRGQYETIFEDLVERETARRGHCGGVAVDLEEVSFLVSHIWRGVSAFRMGRGDSTTDKGLHRRTAGLQLICFKQSEAAVPDNLFLLTDEEAAEFESLGLQSWCHQYPEVHEYVLATFSRIRENFGNLS